MTAACVDTEFSLLTFAVGGLDYPCAVQVMRIKVWEAGRQDGADVALDVTPAQCWRRGANEKSGRWMKGRNEKQAET